MIDIYISRYNQSLINEEINIIDNYKKDQEIYIIVPDQFTLFTGIDLMKKLNLESMINIKVKSFSSFSREVLQTYGGIKNNIISEYGKKITIKNIIQDYNKDLRYLKNSKNQSGIIKQIIKSIENLKEDQVKIEDLDFTLSKDKNQIFLDKVHDLKIIYKEYDNRLKNKYIDSVDRIKLLNEKLSCSDYYKEKIFIFSEFYSLSKEELNVIRNLDLQGAYIHFFLQLDPKILESDRKENIKDYEIFETSLNLYNKLNKISDKNFTHRIFDEKKIIKFKELLDNLFSYDPKSFQKEEKDLHLSKFTSTEDEVLASISLIKKFVFNDKKYNFSDISLFITNDEYKSYIKRYFKKENIPFFLDSKISLKDNYISKYLISYLNILSKGINQVDLIFVLKFEKSFNYEDIEIFEKYIKKKNLKDKMIINEKYYSINDSFIEKLSDDKKDRYIYELLTSKKIANSIRERFAFLYDLKKEQISPEEITDILFKNLSLQSIASINNFIKEKENNIELDLQNNEVWDYFVNLIDETNYLLEGKIILFSNYIELISEQLRDGRIAVIPPNQDTVTIFDITRSRINTSKISIFLGFNDKYIPKITNDNDFFTEKEQQFLQEKDIALRSSSSFISKEESINLFSRLNKTEDEIFIFLLYQIKKIVRCMNQFILI